MNRHQRRALDRRADRAFDRARGSILAYADSARDLAVLRESGEITVLRGDHVEASLVSLGLAATYREIERNRVEHDGRWLPVIVVVLAHASVRWIEMFRLSRGGAA